MHNFLEEKATVFSVAKGTGKLQCSYENIGISRAQYEFDIPTLTVLYFVKSRTRHTQLGEI